MGGAALIMLNQVLHHLSDKPAAGWPAHRRVFRECARVLRPGGVLVINTCSLAQTEQGFWTFHLIPRARAEILRRLMPLPALETALRACGIAPRGRFVPVDAVLQARITSTREVLCARSGAPAIRSGPW